MYAKLLYLVVVSKVTTVEFPHVQMTDLLCQEAVETECESLDEEDDDDGDLHEGQQDVGDHDDVDAEEGELPDVGDEVDPGGGDGHGPELPLPPVPEFDNMGDDFCTPARGAREINAARGTNYATPRNHNISSPNVHTG